MRRCTIYDSGLDELFFEKTFKKSKKVKVKKTLKSSLCENGKHRQVQ